MVRTCFTGYRSRQRPLALALALAVALMCSLAGSISAQNAHWPQWRGADLDLVSKETDWQVQWPVEGPNLLWKTNVGIGYSSVSVVGDRLWTMGHNDNQETVYCLAIDTGKEIWKHSYAGELVDNLHKGGPGSTPTVDGNHVYTLGKQGQLFCLSSNSGDVVWELDARKALGVDVPEWGFNGSPVIVDDRLFLDLGRIVAIDKNNGSVLWKSNDMPAGYGSATPLSFNGTPAVSILNNEGLYVLDASDGSELAFHEWKTNFKTNSTSPIVIDDRQIFLSTGYQRGCTLLKIIGDSLQAVYEADTLSNHMNNSILHQGHMFGFDGNAHRGRTARLVCIELATGKECWGQLGLGCGSLMLAGDKLVILTEKGELVIAEADPKKWTELARAQVIDYRCWTVPVLTDGRFYCRNDAGDLVCIDLNDTK